MKAVPLNRTVLLNRLSEIERDVAKLNEFRAEGPNVFEQDMNFAAAEHYLRRSLEAIFDAGNHILSRLPLAPGERPETYKALAQALGRHKVVPSDFANGPLIQMAGYRNRLVHFYDEITPEELNEIVQHRLGDLETFARALKAVIEEPHRLGLTIQ